MTSTTVTWEKYEDDRFDQAESDARLARMNAAAENLAPGFPAHPVITEPEGVLEVVATREWPDVDTATKWTEIALAEGAKTAVVNA